MASNMTPDLPTIPRNLIKKKTLLIKNLLGDFLQITLFMNLDKILWI